MHFVVKRYFTVSSVVHCAHMHTLYAFTGMMMCKILVRVSDVLHQVKYANKVKTNFPVRKSVSGKQTNAAAEIHLFLS